MFVKRLDEHRDENNKHDSECSDTEYGASDNNTPSHSEGEEETAVKEIDIGQPSEDKRENHVNKKCQKPNENKSKPKSRKTEG